MRRKYTLNNKKIYYKSILIVTIIVVLILGFIILRSYYVSSLYNSSEYLKRENTVSSTFIEGYFNEIINTIHVLSNIDDIIYAFDSDDKRERTLNIYKLYIEANENIEFIYSGYENKELIINDYIPPDDYDPTKRPWYVEALNDPLDIYIGKPYQEIISKEWLISTGKALMNENGEIEGVMAIDCLIDNIVRLFERDLEYESGRNFVINELGEVIIHEDSTLINQIIIDDYDKIFNNKSGYVNFNYNGDYYLAHFTYLDTTKWIVITKVIYSEILNPIILRLIFYGIIIFSIISFLIIIQMSLFSNLKLELLVSEKSKEIEIKNLELEKINKNLLDSINYAKKIQNSILPKKNDLDKYLKEHFVIWIPKDIVGGDFYWFKKTKEGFYIAVVDCTGHGVPGALTTMASNAILNDLVEFNCIKTPSEILSELNVLLKNNFYENDLDKDVYTGLDIALCYFNDKKNQLTFSGAGISLYFKEKNKITRVKSNKKGIGYIDTKDDYLYENHALNVSKDILFFMVSDGYTDQNNENDKWFGRNNLIKMLEENTNLPLKEQKEIYVKRLKEHMKDESQRDDITFLGFKII